MTRDLSCQEFADFLWAYLSSEVSERERLEFELHLAKCPACVVYMNTYQETVALGKQAFDEPDRPLPEDVPEELVAAILSALKRPQA